MLEIKFSSEPEKWLHLLGGASSLQQVFTARPSWANIIPACLSLSQTINLYQDS